MQSILFVRYLFVCEKAGQLRMSWTDFNKRFFCLLDLWFLDHFCELRDLNCDCILSYRLNKKKQSINCDHFICSYLMFCKHKYYGINVITSPDFQTL